MIEKNRLGNAMQLYDVLDEDLSNPLKNLEWLHESHGSQSFIFVSLTYITGS